MTTNRSGNWRTCGACDQGACLAAGSAGKTTNAVDTATSWVVSGGAGESDRLNGT